MAQGLYKSSPVKMTGAAMAQGVGGLMGIAGGIIGGRKRRREQRRAQKEMNRRKGQFEMLDTSNLAANMENHYEDLTVNTQAADFAAQQNQQNMANIMDSQSGAAGGRRVYSSRTVYYHCYWSNCYGCFLDYYNWTHLHLYSL
jgi:hypothetical protein